MASKVLVPTAPFTKLQVKKSPPDGGSGFIIGGDATARVAHLEHSVRFLQEQHRLMLSGLHAEIEALRERNRDLQFQLIFNKESSAKNSPVAEENAESNEEHLRAEIARLELEAAAARGEVQATEARARELQELVDAQAEKIRELEFRARDIGAGASSESGEGEGRAELRARLAEAERLVRRLRADAERQRRELQCMKNSLHASLRAGGLDYGYSYLPLHPQDLWRDPLREEYSMGSRGRNNRRPLTLPELNAVGQPLRATVYANNYARGRGYSEKKKPPPNGDPVNGKSPEETEHNSYNRVHSEQLKTYPELKVVVSRVIPHGNVSTGGERPRARRPHHRKHNPDHT
ncbi:uncharacterized protein LOC121733138 isoform X2 [Aricia agestis]|uniref:uncharacterized protein LOC121733138 isoform X2 n=1 Tax=Aricia agestis TaxID=91739 RepID=UPI001C20AF88|nr:uncharacterized protein LOC121733138 isoform X2 [Aricia agestis]